MLLTVALIVTNTPLSGLRLVLTEVCPVNRTRNPAIATPETDNLQQSSVCFPRPSLATRLFTTMPSCPSLLVTTLAN